MEKKKAKVEHWKKREGNRNETLILNLIQTKPRRFKELLSESHFSTNTLTNHLENLQKKGLVKKTVDNDGNQIYEIVAEKKEIVDAKIGTYEATQFIESLINPFYHIESAGKGLSVSIFAQVENVKHTKAETRRFAEMSSYVTTFFEKFERLKKGDKIALVVTIEGESRP